MTSARRRRVLLALLAAAGAPLVLADAARSGSASVPAGEREALRVGEVARAATGESNDHHPQERIDMQKRTQYHITLAAAAALLAAGVALGVLLERTPMPAEDPLLVYAAKLAARGAGQGDTVMDLAKYLTHRE